MSSNFLRPSLHNQRKRWTTKEEETLHYSIMSGSSWEAVAQVLGRTVIACKAKYGQLRGIAVDAAVKQAKQDFTPMDWEAFDDRTGLSRNYDSGFVK